MSVETPAPTPLDAKNRAFWVCFAVLLLGVALYTGGAIAAWAHTPLGQRPQGEAAAWLTDAEALFQGNLTREPFFRAPAYLAILVTLREAGVSFGHLAAGARAINFFAHLATTALIVGLGLHFWRRRGALVAGALWGFYPPAVFLVLQPMPATLALLVFVGGVAAALGTVWQSPLWQGGRISQRHTWAYPLAAGLAFVLAACLYAPWWPVALAWPVIALFLGRESRAIRLFSALLGMGCIATGLIGFQVLWGGSPQPMSGESLYRLARALEITQPWNAPLPAVEFSAGAPGADSLELEARLSYQVQTSQPPPGHAVMDGYWWRSAVREVMFSPARSGLRALRKTAQFFAAPNYSAGADFSRARAELSWLKYNPLNWGVLLVLGLLGLAVGWRVPATGLAVLLAALVVIGGVIWYPTMEARAPVAALLAVFAGALPAMPWLRPRRNQYFLFAALLAAVLLAWWPRRNSPAEALAARDSRERALACADLDRYDDALSELMRPERQEPLSFFERDMAASWRFKQLLVQLPATPSADVLEKQLLDNGDLARQSPAAQFRCGVCLWLLGRTDGALYYWDSLASDSGSWGAAARQALAESGHETPAEAQRREAWEIGGSPQPHAELAPFFALLRTNPAKTNSPAQK